MPQSDDKWESPYKDPREVVMVSREHYEWIIREGLRLGREVYEAHLKIKTYEEALREKERHTQADG
jgi:hypothetical protein